MSVTLNKNPSRCICQAADIDVFERGFWWLFQSCLMSASATVALWRSKNPMIAKDPAHRLVSHTPSLLSFSR